MFANNILLNIIQKKIRNQMLFYTIWNDLDNAIAFDANGARFDSRSLTSTLEFRPTQLTSQK